MPTLSEVSRAFLDRFARRGRWGRRRRHAQLATIESLENRLALYAPTPVDVTQVGNRLDITYSQGGAITSDQHVVIDIDTVFPALGFPTTRVNVYCSTNPAANPTTGVAYTGIDYLRVVVPNFDTAGTDNNSLTIKGMALPTDRIIISGSGRTAAGRWSDESGTTLQIAFDIEGMDDTTVISGGVINVSGAFTNDTDDASIHAIGEIAERSTNQQTATIIVGETTPADPLVLPHPRLVSDFIEIIGAELDIYSDIVASRHVILRTAESAPGDARSNLVLPYDITVTNTTDGLAELHSTRNITQLQSSTITARKLVAVSNNSNPIPPGTGLDGNAWNIDLGSVNNDFDEIALGMIAAPGDTTNASTQGRIGVRDKDDLTVADFGILALTGMVTMRTGGQLTINSAIQSTGLTLQSNYGITSAAAGVMQIGDLGITIDVANTADGATGDLTLNGRVTVGSGNLTKAPDTKIRSRGTTTITGGIASPQKSTLLIEADEGVLIDAPVQFGSTQLDVNSTTATVFDGDIRLVSNGIGSNGITVRNRPGNEGVPHTLRASEGISFESTGDIVIEGSVLSGSQYGNPSKLTETAALPSITVNTTATLSIAATGSLRTVAYETDPDATTNPLVGLISITGASQVASAGRITADGAVDIDVVGDVSLAGPTTGRENVVIATSSGSIDIQGAVASTGGTYSAAVPTSSQRFPNVMLSARNGAIATSNAGTLRAGTLTQTVNQVTTTTYGTVTLRGQQDIEIGAAIDTPGTIDIATTLGSVSLSALLRDIVVDAQDTVNTITISAGNGVVQTDKILGRIVADLLTVTNTGAAGGVSDIDLRAVDNHILNTQDKTKAGFTAVNFAPGGSILVANNDALVVGGITASRGAVDGAGAPLQSLVSLTSTGLVSATTTAGITQTGAILADALSVTNSSASAVQLGSPANDVDYFAVSNPRGNVTFNDVNGFETGVTRPVGGPLAVEVTGVDLNLTSVIPFSVIRVVSGLRYTTLAIGAGNGNGASVGTVEFVPTATGDNPAPAGLTPVFAGTLRDMIRYINDNSAVYTAANSIRSQPMALVFDEAGYPVNTVTLQAALPTLNRAITLDGGRLETTVLAGGQTRLEVTQAAGKNLAYGLSFAPAIPSVPGRTPAYPGSAGSSIQHLSMYGFTAGSALVIGSGNNTVADFYAGLKSDGTFGAANFVGLDITGIAATNNRVGSTVFDPATVNRFGGNTSAGILIRNNASGTRVYGNVIGDDTGITPAFANGDGIRIAGSIGNLIGTPDEVQPDQTPSVSNMILGNSGNGISIVTATGTATAANVLRNNLISGNKVGVTISGSRFATLGGVDNRSANVVTSQTSDGVAILSSSDVQLLGNTIGLASGLAAANAGNGVSIAGTSQRVAIASGNRIAANVLNGVSIASGVTGVTITGSTIGGLLDDGVTPAGNGKDGVAIRSAVGNTVGAGNTISFNAGNGVSIADARGATLLAGNKVSGSSIASNSGHGVFVTGGSNSTIGGTTAGTGNVIATNGRSGIYFERSAATGMPAGYAIQGNFVGTNTNRDVDATLGNLSGGIVLNDASGVRIEANTVMNNLRAGDPNYANDPNDGITLRGGTGNVVGGATAAQGNLVTNNQQDGIRVVGPTATRAAQGHRISGNTINSNGDAAASTGNGVTVTGAFARGIAVGQTVTTAGVTGLGNTISENGNYGVAVTGGAQQVAIQGNSIFANGTGGIFIAPGSNESTASPGITLTSATIRQPAGSQSQILLQGSLRNAVRGQQYTVDVYANSPPFGVGFPPADSAAVQGQRFLGRITVTATANGTIVWNAKNPLRISARVLPGEYITATVTALRVQPGSTSNFSSDAQGRPSWGVLARR